MSEGYVFQITLREGIKWEDGEEITADDYIESFRRLMDPSMKNGRAKNYYTGETAVAGAKVYHRSGSIGYEENTDITFDELTQGADGVYETADGNKVYIAVSYPLDNYLWGDTLADLAEYLDADGLAELQALANEEGCVPLTDRSRAALVKTISTDNWGEDETSDFNYYVFQVTYPTVTWDTVGLYKLGEYDLIYVNEKYIDLYNFMDSLTSSWLVNTSVYDDNTDPETAETSYGTSVDSTVSFGPYRLVTAADTQMVFVKNPNYYAYTFHTESGRYVGTSVWEVDGETTEIYQADKIVIRELSQADARTAYDNRELDIYQPRYTELTELGQSENTYKEDESYIMRLFFNTDIEALQNMDEELGNENSVVLSNDSFRKAFSLAINRPEWVNTTFGYEPAYVLLNDVYYYDFYGNPASNLRRSEQAMKSVCEMYEVGYGEGQTYATLKEAYDSVTGYDLNRARSLMSQACQELTAAGLYEQGQPIKIKVAWKKGALDETDIAQVMMLQDYLNAAADGTGFGSIELEAVGDIENRYVAVPVGEFAIGYGAWGGAAFYPFDGLRVYCDPDYASIQERACWNPAEEVLTISINGEDCTETYQWWSKCISGEYASADDSVKLQIIAQLEKGVLEQYNCIPLAASALCEVTSDKVDYYTHDYSMGYGFGGLELIRFNYTDDEWENASQHEHVWGECINNNDAACLKDGTATRTCSICGKTETIELAGTALGHDWDEGEVIEEATYTETGIKTYICLRCGETRTEEIPMLAPEAPALKSATNTATGVKFTWAKSEGAVKYRVYRKSGDSGWSKLADVGDVSSYTDTTAESGNTYSYTVRGVSAAGDYSKYDKTGVSVTYYAPPVLNSASSVSSGITVSWEKVNGITGYRVYRKTEEDSSWSKLADVGDVSSYTDKTVEAGQTYSYTVRCLSADGKSTVSAHNPDGVTATFIAAPVLKSASNAATGVKFTWVKSDGATKYRVYRKEGSGSWKKLADVGDVNTYTDTTAVSGTTYSYTVRCLSEDGKNTVSGYDTTGKSVTYYAAPVLESVTSSSSGLTISWEKSEGATRYRVYRKSGDSGWSKLADVGDVSSYTDKTAEAGTEYKYTVRCLSEDGSSTISSYDPEGKSGMIVAAPVLKSAANAATGVKVTWVKSAGATKYRVYRKEGSGSWKKVADVGDVNTYTDTTAVSGTTYSYTVRCLSEDGKSTISGYDTTGKSVTYYAAPVLKSTSNTASGVTVNWEKSEGAVKYRVYRKSGDSGWSKIADVGDVSSYTDKKAAAGTTYKYTVRCLSEDGSSTISSYDSNGIEATYIAPPVLKALTNVGNGVLVEWEASAGAENYRVFRKVSGGSWSRIGDTTDTTFMDTTGVLGTTYTYTVRCVTADGKSYTSAYDSKGLSVLYE